MVVSFIKCVFVFFGCVCKLFVSFSDQKYMYQLFMGM